MVDTIHSANAAAVLYSIAETAKLNMLKPYEYFEFLLSDIPRHMGEKNTEFVASLLPWSASLPESVKSKSTES